MAKSWDRGMGRSSRMHEKLIDRAERTMWFQPPKESPEVPETKRAWTPERWAHRISTAAKK